MNLRHRFLSALLATFLGTFVSGGSLLSADPVKELQKEAITSNKASWGHWGPDSEKYSSWTTHSNRLVPLYSFGFDLESVRGAKSIYRDAGRLSKLYGFAPTETVNPDAEYCDQTDVYQLQKQAIAAGKKKIILIIFDGMDWQTTYAAATYKNKGVKYQDGRGTGLSFQDYSGVKTDYGYIVTSPANDGTNTNVDDQKVTGIGKTLGGFDWRSNGDKPWSSPKDIGYPIAKGEVKHAFTDSASGATSMTCGIKTYNDAINVDTIGRPVMSIARQLQEQEFAIGVVTSVPISHATPACAYANNVHRDDYQDLTRDMIGVPSVANPGGLPGVDVLIGAGWGENKDKDGAQGKNFVPGNRYLTEDDLKKINVANGGKYVVAERTSGKKGSEVLASQAKVAIDSKSRFFGYFGTKGGHLPFRTADGNYDPTLSVGLDKQAPKAEEYSQQDMDENPNLAEMTSVALDVLESRNERWWLMIEAGDVDWANHANNIDNSIGAVLSGEEAFTKTVEWVEKNKAWEDTAIFVTADHGHYLFLTKPESLSGNEQ